MPNGGMMPCCRVCKWSENLPPEAVRENIGSVQCTRHKLDILNSHYTFCADLSGDDGLASFVTKNSIKTGMIYQWIETSFIDPKYPTIQQYHHEYSELVTIEEYPDYSSHMGAKLREAFERLKAKQKKDGNSSE